MSSQGDTHGTLEERFWRKVDVRGPDDCWPWTGARYSNGYGKIGEGPAGGATLSAHRVSFVLANGEPTHCVLHMCDNKECVNPAHLWDGTKQENTADMFSKSRDRWSLAAQAGSA